jgi:predicted dehydrogenase
MTRSTHRRDFLRASAAFGAGLWVVGSRPALFGRNVNDEIRCAVIGAGGRGEAHVAGLPRAGGTIVALCDVDERQMAEAVGKHPKAKTYRDYRKMFDEMHREIDAVAVATADHTHAVASTAAMRLGKHCYCEKPLTRSIHEARAMARIAAEMKVASQMGNQGHSNNGARRTVEAIRAGVIGPVKEVHAWTNRPIWPQGIEARPESEAVPKEVDWDVWLGPAQEVPYSSAYHPFKWRGWWDFGTGALGDMACHILDVAFWALDLRDPTSIEMVDASGRNDLTGPNWSITEFHFPPRNGRAAVKLTWYEGGKKPPTELFEGEEVPEGGSILVGEKGKAYIPHDYGDRFVLLPKKDFEGFKPPPETLVRSPGHHKDFLEACRDPIDRPACSNFAYAAGLTETVLLGVLAQRVGQKIEWDPVGMRATNCPDADRFIKPEYRRGWEL